MEDDRALAHAKAEAIAQPHWGMKVVPTNIDRRNCQRTRPMEVLCLGRERTGTLSLRTALLLLGYYDVYHMGSALLENPADGEMWAEALDGTFKPDSGKKPFTREQWDALLGHCAAVTDQPCALFGQELMEAYPDAKVVLTVRDTPQAWHKSVVITILTMISLFSPHNLRHPGWNPFNYIQRLVAPKMSGHPSSQAFFDKTVEALDGDALRDEGVATELYLAHNQHIRDLVREKGKEGQFLEFNVKQGWEPLCTFLGKPVPEGVPFPNVNDSAEREEMNKNLRFMVNVGYLANTLKVLGPPALAVGAWWWLRKR